MAEKQSTHLAELQHKPYYKIPEDQPDVTGWYIVDDTAKKIGTVLDLLIDPEAKKVRYVVTNLKDGMMEEDHTVLIPIWEMPNRQGRGEAGSASSFPRAAYDAAAIHQTGRT